jgi:phage shock protein A
MEMQFGDGNLATDVIALRQRFKELEDGRRQTGQASNRYETAALDLLTQDVRELERLALGSAGSAGGGNEHLERSMTVIREKLKEMEGRVTDASFRLNQYTFSTF